MKKRFQSVLLCSCIIMSTCFMGCTPKTPLDTEGSSISELMSSESETEQESSGISTEPSESESNNKSTSEQNSESENSSESEHESESCEPSESASGSESKNASESESGSESEKPSESESKKPSESTKPSESKKPSESTKPSKEDNVKDEPSEPEVTFMGNTLETSKTELGTKYGVVVYEITNIQYALYSDGTKKEVSRESFTTLDNDRSGYHATDEELLPETLEVANANKSIYAEATKYVNEYRTQDGVGTVSLSEELCKKATMRAIEMYYADYVEHRRADGRDATWSDVFPYPCNSECCYYNSLGYVTPQDAVNAWRNSPAHNGLMTNPNNDNDLVGFGYFNGYWVMIFSNHIWFE